MGPRDPPLRVVSAEALVSARMTGTQTGVRIALAAEGSANVATGLPVLDHLISELARTARFKVSLEVAPESTDEAVAAAGRAFGEALGALASSAAPAAAGRSCPPAEALAVGRARARRRAAARHNVDFSGQRVGGLATDVASRFLQGARRGRTPQPPRPAAGGNRSAARPDRDLQGGRRGARPGVPARTATERRARGKEVVRTEAAPAPFQGAPYSQAIKANGFVFVSGQLSLRPGDKELSAGEIGPQTEQVFANLRAILEAAGSSLDQLVKTTVFLQNLDDFAGMNEVYSKHVGDTPPARSTVEVAKLPSGALVEIEAIALAQ